MSVCENCHNYKTHGNKCWYYWENKQACSQYKNAAEDEPHHEQKLIQIHH